MPSRFSTAATGPETLRGLDSTKHLRRSWRGTALIECTFIDLCHDLSARKLYALNSMKPIVYSTTHCPNRTLCGHTSRLRWAVGTERESRGRSLAGFCFVTSGTQGRTTLHGTGESWSWSIWYHPMRSVSLCYELFRIGNRCCTEASIETRTLIVLCRQ